MTDTVNGRATASLIQNERPSAANEFNRVASGVPNHQPSAEHTVRVPSSSRGLNHQDEAPQRQRVLSDPEVGAPTPAPTPRR